MCGIVGYIGAQEAAPIVLHGLRQLEYRGYDSAGLAVIGADHAIQGRREGGQMGHPGGGGEPAPPLPRGREGGRP